MPSLITSLNELNAELVAHRLQAAEAHRLLDAAGIEDRGAGLHIRVASLLDEVARLRAAIARLTGEELPAAE